MKSYKAIRGDKEQLESCRKEGRYDVGENKLCYIKNDKRRLFYISNSTKI